MKIVNPPAPDVKPRPARAELIYEPVTRDDVRRAPWTPNRSKMVILECGHVEMAYPVLRIIGRMAKEVFCETCDKWIPIWRDASPAERAGIDIPPPYLGDEPPF